MRRAIEITKCGALRSALRTLVPEEMPKRTGCSSSRIPLTKSKHIAYSES